MARVEVPMPQMGESIAEGTVSKWLKQAGEAVAKDEPLLEISTDKVDAEVPSPAAGKLLEIKVGEGETVEVGSVLALVGAEGAAVSQPSTAPPPAAVAPTIPVEVPKQEVQPQAKAASVGAGGNGQKSDVSITVDELRRTKSSPLVRKIAEEHGI